MARRVAETCRNCGAALSPGAAFCILCGSAVPNRAANETPGTVSLNSGSVENPNLNDTAVPSSIPGIIAVGSQPRGPLVQPRQLGDNAMMNVGTELVTGGAGRRLLAKIIDGLVPGVLLGVAAGIGLALSAGSAKTVGGQLELNLTWLLILTGVAGALSLAYCVWIWFLEAKKGTTPGNLMTGLRTTNMDGEAAGKLAIFLRQLIITVGSIVPYVGTILVIISNAWDSNEKKQGWHDKVAHTLVFNVKAGRNPLETGGVTGRVNYVPPASTGISQISSPMPTQGLGAPAVRSSQQHPAEEPAQPAGLVNSFSPPQLANSFAPPAQSGPITSVPHVSSFARPASGQATSGQAAPGFPTSNSQSFGQQQYITPPPNFGPGSGPAAAQSFQGGGIPGQKSQEQDVQKQNSSALHNGTLHNPAQLNPAQTGGVPNAAFVDPFGSNVEDDFGETRVRSANSDSILRLTFDDGRVEDVRQISLIGRNPAGYDGEMIESLVPVHDSSRSVSKTHLHVRVAAEGLWVTDRNSTNGSAIRHVNGQKDKLMGGIAAMAEIGSRVHFGDRSFTVGRP